MLNGGLVTAVRLPPFIVTLGTLNIAFALTHIISNDLTFTGLPKLELFWGRTFTISGTDFTYGVVLMLVLYALTWYGLNQTAWGRHVYAVGDNREAARLTGINTDRVLLSDLDGQVDLVLCNPPYVPTNTEVPPEVRDHDPKHAVFAGADGLDVIRHVVTAAARLLKPGGWVGIEHDDTQGGSVPALLSARRVLTGVSDHLDLAARPRYATAQRG